MRKLFISPEQEGYAVENGEGALQAILDGGEAFQRPDHAGASDFLSASWTLDAVEYRYMRAFYNTGTGASSLPFLIDLINAEGVPTLHRAKLVPGSFSAVSVSGKAYGVTALIEIVGQATLDADNLTTETGDVLLTEAGDSLLWEGS